MKSFADWTQELAESVGEVKHHWETRKEAELKGIDSEISFDWGAPTEAEDAAIEPNWQAAGGPVPVPPAPDHPIAVAYARCDNCAVTHYLYEHDVYGKKYHVCQQCLNALTGSMP